MVGSNRGRSVVSLCPSLHPRLRLVGESQALHTWQRVWGGAFSLGNYICWWKTGGRQEEILTKLTTF